MDIQMYRSFLVVAKCRNFTQTAKYLNFTQPTITNHIQALEQLYGTTLFTREGKNVYLTDAGRAFVPLVEKLLSDYNTGLDAMRNFNQKKKQLRIAISTQFINYYLIDVVCKMQALVPDLTIKIDRCMDVEALIEQTFIRKNYDLAFVHKDVQPLDTKRKTLWHQKVVWVGAPSLWQEMGKNEDIYEYPFIGYKENSVYYKLYENEVDFSRLKKVMIFNDSESVIYAAKQGLGIALVPEVKIRESLQREELVLLPNIAHEYIPVSLLMSCDLNLTPEINKFLHLVSQVKA